MIDKIFLVKDVILHSFHPMDCNYMKVCGLIRGYQYGTVDAIYPNWGSNEAQFIDGAYIDGLSITHGINPRHHIWTYAAGYSENGTHDANCPCHGSNETTSYYVGEDYYCESATATEPIAAMFYPNDPLWDGQQCNHHESACCTSSKMPWFIKTLNQWTSDDIELRMCTTEGYPQEATPIDIVEIYIR